MSADGAMPSVLFAASEAAPLVKTGGLADVAGALPGALRRLGCDARVLLPGYPAVLTSQPLAPVAKGLDLLPGQPPADLLEGRLPDDTPMLVVASPLFEREGGPYVDAAGLDWPDNHLRFGSLSRAAALLGGPESPLAWRPQVVHLNDWQTALAAAWLAWMPLPRARTVLSLHNMAFAGAFDAGVLPALGLPWSCFQVDGVEFYGRLSFLKAGIYYADRLATVSPTYAREIQHEALGGGLHGLLTTRAADLRGILNGIDGEVWNPGTDPLITQRYDEQTLADKARNRSALREEVGLPQLEGAMLLGMVTRLTWQKGADLVAPAMARLADLPLQLAVLGAGDRDLESALRALAEAEPDRVAVTVGYDERLAHRIEAGADAFLMPSRFEPCGLNQLYSMRYGTPPVVRATGGLADSVVDTDAASLADGSATGFVFQDASADALAATVRRAAGIHAHAPSWQAVQRNGMRQDWSWRRSAEAYVELYREALRAP